MITVACVLRSGGEYEPWHVWALQDGVASHLPLPHRFVCVTDTEVNGVETRPLRHDWPGWWSKVELWRPDNFTGRVLYFDLDTAIVGDLSDLASYDGRFGMINDLGLPEGGKNRHRFGASGVMAWAASPTLSRDIYETFARMSESAMKGREVAGDQHWIAGSVNDAWDDLRALYPGQIQSWKFTAGRNQEIPEGTRVLCWHGHPKPWDVEVQWVKRSDYDEAA